MMILFIIIGRESYLSELVPQGGLLRCHLSLISRLWTRSSSSLSSCCCLWLISSTIYGGVVGR